MTDAIKRRLEEKKAEIQKNKPSLVPAGVPERGEDKNMVEEKIPGFITGGPKTSKKMKEV